MTPIPPARAVDPSAVRESSRTSIPWWRHLLVCALGAAVSLVSMMLFDSGWLPVALAVGLVGAGGSYAWLRLRRRR
ncbi:MAG: hypothetical protein HGA44_21020 [Cellulomonadaceae bacterium]|nr:hypothetical protein [Cellulomonadaceae bacterium]